MRTNRGLSPIILCFGIAFALYLATMATGVQWGDHAELQLAAANPDLGLGVRSYPLWTILAAGTVRVFSLEPAFGANLLTAFFGAMAVALCHLYVRAAFGSRIAAWIAAFSLMVCHLLWTFSTVAEIYSLAACFLFLLLITAEWSLQHVRRGAFFLGLVAGVSLLHHRMIQLAAVSMLTVLVVLWHRRGELRPGIIFGLLGTVIGALPMASLFLLLARPASLVERVHSFLLGGFSPHLPDGLGLGTGLAGLLLYSASFIAFNLPGPQGFFFLLSFRRRRPSHPGHRALLFAFILGSLPTVLLLPHVGDRYVLLLPAVCAAVALAGVAAAERANRAYRRVLIPLLCLLCPPLFYGAFAVLDIPAKLGLFQGVDRVHREEFLWPGHSRDRSAEAFAEKVLRDLPADAVLLTEWGDGCVLLYASRIQGLRPDVRIRQTLWQDRFDVAVRDNAGRRVFMTTYPHTPPTLRAPPGFALMPRIPAMLWEVVPDDRR